MSDDDYTRKLSRAWEDLAGVPTWHERRGEALGWLGRRRLEKAVAALAQCHAARPDDPLGAWGLGRAKLCAGDAAGAAPLLRAAAGGGAPNADLCFDRAVAALALGDAAEAEEQARAAVDLRPDDDGLKVTYTYALLIAGHPKRALGVIANVCKRDPDHGAARAAIELVRRVLNGDTPAPTKVAPGT